MTFAAGDIYTRNHIPETGISDNIQFLLYTVSESPS